MGLQHCPSCGSLQPLRDRCAVCGAALGDPDGWRARDVVNLARTLFLIFGGIVVVGTVLLIGLYLLL